MNGNKEPKLNIVSFIIGLLVGAIISTGSIYFYTLTTNTDPNNANIQQGMQVPSMPPDDENGGGTPPNRLEPTSNMQQRQ